MSAWPAWSAGCADRPRLSRWVAKAWRSLCGDSRLGSTRPSAPRRFGIERNCWRVRCPARAGRNRNRDSIGRPFAPRFSVSGRASSRTSGAARASAFHQHSMRFTSRPYRCTKIIRPVRGAAARRRRDEFMTLRPEQASPSARGSAGPSRSGSAARAGSSPRRPRRRSGQRCGRAWARQHFIGTDRPALHAFGRARIAGLLDRATAARWAVVRSSPPPPSAPDEARSSARGSGEGRARSELQERPARSARSRQIGVERVLRRTISAQHSKRCQMMEPCETDRSARGHHHPPNAAAPASLPASSSPRQSGRPASAAATLDRRGGMNNRPPAPGRMRTQMHAAHTPLSSAVSTPPQRPTSAGTATGSAPPGAEQRNHRIEPRHRSARGPPAPHRRRSPPKPRQPPDAAAAIAG